MNRYLNKYNNESYDAIFNELYFKILSMAKQFGKIFHTSSNSLKTMQLFQKLL